jgi:hypothetical protein
VRKMRVTRGSVPTSIILWPSRAVRGRVAARAAGPEPVCPPRGPGLRVAGFALAFPCRCRPVICARPGTCRPASRCAA